MGFFLNNDLFWGVGIRGKEGGRKQQCVCHRFRKKMSVLSLFLHIHYIEDKKIPFWNNKAKGNVFCGWHLIVCSRCYIITGRDCKEARAQLRFRSLIFCFKMWAFLPEPRFTWPHVSPLVLCRTHNSVFLYRCLTHHKDSLWIVFALPSRAYSFTANRDNHASFYNLPTLTLPKRY